MTKVNWLLAWLVAVAMIILTCFGAMRFGEGSFLWLTIGAYVLVPATFSTMLWLMSKRNERTTLAYAVNRICPECKYDRRGIDLTVPCPECHAPAP